jgi:toxin ParE1/3/4
MRVVRTLLADEDLLEIWLYIAQDNIPAADRILDQLDQRCQQLATYPELGTQRNDLVNGMRCLIEGNYAIFYRINPNQIQVLRILHGARDFSTLF